MQTMLNNDGIVDDVDGVAFWCNMRKPLKIISGHVEKTSPTCVFRAIIIIIMIIVIIQKI